MTYDHETGPGWSTHVFTIRLGRWTLSLALDRNRD
jgi:hypothetical protein